VNPELSIVLPAYREAAALDALLPALKSQVAQLTPSHEIVVVDAERPIDNTGEICRIHGVHHMHRTNGNTYGDAVRSGIQVARGEFVVFMDADGSHNPASLPSLWKERRKFDIVIGSRYIAGGKTENPAILVFMSWVVNVIFRTCFGLSCRDVTNSFRLYRGAQLRALNLRSNNFDIVEEILIKLCGRRFRASVIEVPVVFERRKAGESKRNLIAFAATYLGTLIHLLWINWREK
jgi:dolichol-phosphate mannosyltransferase